jgi:V-type H+-transporting ATPase subunit a
MQEILDNNEADATANFYNLSEESVLNPPTYIRTNDFLWAFQEIVNTYGIPRYREINPTFFNIVTFPFLFGIMFGDIGHGFLLFSFGIYLCLNHENLKSDSNFKMISKARYLLLGMGFFAFFAGLVYNDFLSIPLGVFSTCWKVVDLETGRTEKIPGCEYLFGLDHRWYVSRNELTFVNSLKMKTSVILGVSQMIFGILLKCANAIHFGNKLDLFLEGIPQLLFMCFLFGYMNALVIIKWSVDWTESIRSGVGCPSIITQMMNFIIGMGGIVSLVFQ